VSDSIERNQQFWTGEAPRFAVAADRHWATDEIAWGIWGIPEAEAGLLAGIELDGADVVELGCGTAYVAAWLARRGARVVGIDPTAAQLATAAQMQRVHGPTFPLLQAAAEHVPLRSGSFDLAISEYGAAIWADPHVWLPEAARLLRPGGWLVFLGNATTLVLCANDDEDVPATERMLRPAFGLHRVEWSGDEGVEFHLTHGEQIRVLRGCGFAIEGLIELQPPEGATTSYSWITAEWARRWPSEEVWRARKA
jgi:SAM-dependent methyltransferase